MDCTNIWAFIVRELIPGCFPRACNLFWSFWGNYTIYIICVCETRWWELWWWSPWICFSEQSFIDFIAQNQLLCPKKLFTWFQWFKGSKLWPNNTVNTKFCVNIFWGAHKSRPPQKCTVSHCANGPGWPLWTVNFSLLIAQLWPIMTQDYWLWSGMTYHGSGGAKRPREGPRVHQQPPGGTKLLPMP